MKEVVLDKYDGRRPMADNSDLYLEFEPGETFAMGIPNQGAIADGSEELLKQAQVSLWTITRPVRKGWIFDLERVQTPKDLQGTLPNGEITVVSLSEGDILQAVLRGNLEMGIIGGAVLDEYGPFDPNSLQVGVNLGFAEERLALATIEVRTRDGGSRPEISLPDLRIVATRSPRTVQAYLEKKNIRATVLEVADPEVAITLRWAQAGTIVEAGKSSIGDKLYSLGIINQSEALIVTNPTTIAKKGSQKLVESFAQRLDRATKSRKNDQAIEAALRSSTWRYP